MRETLSCVQQVALAGIGVDAWGVDYALLGERGELLQNPYHYRDRRTQGVMEEVFRKVPREQIYLTTGIQFMPINTLYQLLAAQRDTPTIMAAAEAIGHHSRSFSFLAYGKRGLRVAPNATTTQLVDPLRRSWATNLIQQLGLRADLPAPIVEPGSILGTLMPSVAPTSTLAATPVIAPACHDTGSAVAAITARDGTAFLESDLVSDWHRTRCTGGHVPRPSG